MDPFEESAFSHGAVPNRQPVRQQQWGPAAQRDSEDQTETIRLKLTSAAAEDNALNEELGEDSHPFAISVKVIAKALDGTWSTARVSVLGGTYKTFGGTAFPVQFDFPAIALTQDVLKSAPLFGVYVLVPVEPAEKADAGAVLCHDGQYAKAKAGGQVVLLNSQVQEYPFRWFRPALGPFFAVFVGSWTIRKVEAKPSIFENRAFISQQITSNIVVGGEDNSPNGGSTPEGMQFYYADGATEFFSQKQILDGYDPDTDTDWSFKVPVASSKINQAGTFAGDDGTQLFDNDAGVAQTYYRVPIIRGSRRIAFGGAYSENIRCNGSKGPTVELLKIG